MVCQTKNSEIFRVIVGVVVIGVMNLHSLARLVADTTSVVMLEKNFC